jgi:D-amino-acid oxidase
MRVYLQYLAGRLATAGGKLEMAPRMSSLGEVAEQAPITVNCTGSGARDLVPDPDVTPIRGQLAVVANPGLKTFLAEETGTSTELAYVLPQGEQVVLGGTAEPGCTDLTPDPKIGEAILARCAELEPKLRGARILHHRVGLRPSRPRVRVELDGASLIHNYGHGGAGVTLSWGCAQEVLSLVTAIRGSPPGVRT